MTKLKEDLRIFSDKNIKVDLLYILHFYEDMYIGAGSAATINITYKLIRLDVIYS